MTATLVGAELQISLGAADDTATLSYKAGTDKYVVTGTKLTATEFSNANVGFVSVAGTQAVNQSFTVAAGVGAVLSDELSVDVAVESTSVLGAIDAAGAIKIGSAKITLAADITTTDSNQNYDGAVTLNADVVLSSGTGAITFAQTVDGGFALAVNSTGVTTFGGAVGGKAALASLTTDAGGSTSLAGNVSTTGSAGQQYGDNVTLRSDVTIDAGAGNVSFAGTVNSGVFGVTDTITTDFPLTGLALDAGAGLAYASLPTLNEVGVLDLATGQPTGTISVGPSPAGIAVDATRGLAYVTNSGANTVSVIDTAARTEVATVTVGSAPYGLALSSDGNTLYVANRDSNSVSVIDTLTNMVKDTISVGSVPLDCGLSPDGSQLAVTNNLDNTVSLIDTKTNTVTAKVTVGSGAGGVRYSPAGDKIYVANSDDGTLSVIDRETATVQKTIPVGAGAGYVAVSPNGLVMVTLIDSGAVVIVDSASDTVYDRVQVDGSPTGVVISPDGQLAGVGNYGGYATVISLAATERSLTVNSSGATTFGGAVGGIGKLASLTTDAGGSVSLSSVTTAGAQSYGDDTAVLNGDYKTTDSAFTVTGVATLDGNVGVDTGNGDVHFESTLDGGYQFSVTSTGASAFDDAIGGQTPLSAVYIQSKSVSLKDVTTEGYQFYDVYSATLTGGYATSDGGFTVTGITTLVGDTTVSSAAGDIAFAKAVDGAHALLANSTGKTAFGEAVGGTTPLVSLSTDAGGSVSLKDVTTTGSQSYADDTVRLDGTYTTAASDFSVAKAAVLAGDATVSTTGGAITFSGTIDGAWRLAANSGAGTTKFGGAIGSVVPLLSLATDAGGSTVVSGGPIKATSAGYLIDPTGGTVLWSDGQPVDDEVQTRDLNLPGSPFTTVDVSSNGNVNVSLSDSFENTAFPTDVARIAPLWDDLFIQVGSGQKIVEKAVAGQYYSVTWEVSQYSADAPRYSFQVVLFGAPTTIGNTTFFPGDIAYAYRLVTPDFRRGDATVGIDVGNGTSFATLPELIGSGGVLTNDQASLLPLTSDGVLVSRQGGTFQKIAASDLFTTSPNSVVFNDAVTIAADTTIDANAGAITFASTLNGGYALTANTTGTTTFGGAVGGNAALTSLTTDAGGTTVVAGGVITTVDDQVFKDDVVLQSDTVLGAKNGDIDFEKTLEGGYTLTVDASEGDVSFRGTVGQETPIAGLSLKAAKSVTAFETIKLDGTTPRVGGTTIPFTDGLTIHAGVNKVSLTKQGSEIRHFEGSGVVFLGGSTQSAVGGFAIANNKQNGIVVNKGDYAGTAIRSNGIYANGLDGISLAAAGDAITNLTIGGDKKATTSEGNQIYSNTSDGIQADAGSYAGTVIEGNAFGSSKTAFTTTAGGTQVTLVGDQTSWLVIGQTAGLAPSTPTPGVWVLRTITAVSLNEGNTVVTLSEAIDATTTGGDLVVGNLANGIFLNANGGTLSGLTVGAGVGGDAKYGNAIYGSGKDGVVVGTGTYTNSVIGDHNAIALNFGDGMKLAAGGAKSLQITGNIIGKDVVRTTSESAGNFNGIRVFAGDYLGTVIGGNSIKYSANDGVRLAAAGGAITNLSVVSNSISANDSDGIQADNGDYAGTVIQSNRIFANGVEGIFLATAGDKITNLTVGGDKTSVTSQGNEIYSNTSDGIQADAGTYTGTVIQGNKVFTNTLNGINLNANGGTIGSLLIGAGEGGAARFGNEIYSNTQDGILVGSVVGTASVYTGTVIGDHNEITLNAQNGIELGDGGATGLLITGNKIGTLADGTTAKGNVADGILVNRGGYTGTAIRANSVAFNTLDGIHLKAATGTITNLTVGGEKTATPSQGNSIYSNKSDGIQADKGKADTANYSGTVIQGNDIYANQANGIFLNSDGGTIGSLLIGGDASKYGNAIHENVNDGILVDSKKDSVGNLSGTVIGAYNDIYLNTQNGIELGNAGYSSGIAGLSIVGNSVGTLGFDNKADKGNKANGIKVNAGDYKGTYTSTAVQSNVIALNSLDGILLAAAGDTITNLTVGGEKTATPNQGNSIYSNKSDGIQADKGKADTANYSGTVIQGNDISKNQANGIFLNSDGGTIGSLLIGGDASKYGNAIHENVNDGILVDSKKDAVGNLSGTVIGSYNDIYLNTQNGIELGNAGYSSGIAGLSIVGNSVGTLGFDNKADKGNKANGIKVNAGDYKGTYTSTAVQSNVIALNSLDGILLAAAGDTITNLTVGGDKATQGNSIYSNKSDGIQADKGKADTANYSGTVIQGNDISKNQANGILVQGRSLLIGGKTDPASDKLGNTIHENQGEGILVSGAGQDALGNAILSNSIYLNGVIDKDHTSGNGIVLTDNGNNLQKAPNILGIIRDNTSGTGGVNVEYVVPADGRYLVQFFVNTPTDERNLFPAATNGFEGRTLVGQDVVTGRTMSQIKLDSASCSVGDWLAATATKLVDGQPTDTSAFAIAAQQSAAPVLAIGNDAPESDWSREYRYAVTQNEGGVTLVISGVIAATSSRFVPLTLAQANAIRDDIDARKKPAVGQIGAPVVVIPRDSKVGYESYLDLTNYKTMVQRTAAGGFTVSVQLTKRGETWPQGDDVRSVFPVGADQGTLVFTEKVALGASLYDPVIGTAVRTITADDVYNALTTKAGIPTGNAAAFVTRFQGGLRTVAADIDGDGNPEAITAPGGVANTVSKALSGVFGNATRVITIYNGIKNDADPNLWKYAAVDVSNDFPGYTGGFLVAVGDVRPENAGEGSGVVELVVASTSMKVNKVVVYDVTLTGRGKQPVIEVGSRRVVDDKVGLPVGSRSNAGPVVTGLTTGYFSSSTRADILVVSSSGTLQQFAKDYRDTLNQSRGRLSATTTTKLWLYAPEAAKDNARSLILNSQILNADPARGGVWQNAFYLGASLAAADVDNKLSSDLVRNQELIVAAGQGGLGNFRVLSGELVRKWAANPTIANATDLTRQLNRDYSDNRVQAGDFVADVSARTEYANGGASRPGYPRRGWIPGIQFVGGRWQATPGADYHAGDVPPVPGSGLNAALTVAGVETRDFKARVFAAFGVGNQSKNEVRQISWDGSTLKRELNPTLPDVASLGKNGGLRFG